MRSASVLMHGIPSGLLEEHQPGGPWTYRYLESYTGPPISLTLPLQREEYSFAAFPPFFDGLLPEGVQLEALLRQNKIDRKDCFSQLVAVGKDLVGAVTVEEMQ
ncbi:MAG: HipA N-terminal domain-containing protein [Bacteroidota bacterium]